MTQDLIDRIKKARIELLAVSEQIDDKPGLAKMNDQLNDVLIKLLVIQTQMTSQIKPAKVVVR